MRFCVLFRPAFRFCRREEEEAPSHRQEGLRPRPASLTPGHELPVLSAGTNAVLPGAAPGGIKPRAGKTPVETCSGGSTQLGAPRAAPGPRSLGGLLRPPGQVRRGLPSSSSSHSGDQSRRLAAPWASLSARPCVRQLARVVWLAPRRKEEDDRHEPVPGAAGSGPRRSSCPPATPYSRHCPSTSCRPTAAGRWQEDGRGSKTVVLPDLAVPALPDVVRGVSPHWPPHRLNP